MIPVMSAVGILLVVCEGVLYSDVGCSPLELELQQTFEAVDNRLWFKNGGEASNVLYVYVFSFCVGKHYRLPSADRRPVEVFGGIVADIYM